MEERPPPLLRPSWGPLANTILSHMGGLEGEARAAQTLSSKCPKSFLWKHGGPVEKEEGAGGEMFCSHETNFGSGGRPSPHTNAIPSWF